MFQLLTDVRQGEIENPVETDIEMAEIDDETDNGKYCTFWNPRLTEKFHKTNFSRIKAY